MTILGLRIGETQVELLELAPAAEGHRVVGAAVAAVAPHAVVDGFPVDDAAIRGGDFAVERFDPVARLPATPQAAVVLARSGPAFAVIAGMLLRD